MEPFDGPLAADRLYDPIGDMWVRLEADGRATVGATAFGLWLAGEIIAFTAKPNGAEVDAGRGLGTVECRKTVLAVRSPVGLRALEGNEAAEERPDLLGRDPYGAGWMVRGQPTDWPADSARLVDPAAYRAHCLEMAPGSTVTIA